MQLVSESLCRCPQVGLSSAYGIFGEYRRTREPEQEITFEFSDDGRMHVAELRTVALIENDDDFLLEDRMFRMMADKDRKFLNGRDDDLRRRVFQLTFQNRRTRIAVGCPSLKLVILAHRLVVEVLAVDHKQHLVDVRQFARQLCRFERRKSFAAARRMPNIPAAFYRTIAFVTVGHVDFIQDAFRRYNLIGTHDEQHPVGGKYAVPGQQIEQRMLGEECAAETHQIGNRPVVGICPPRGELKAVARLPTFGAVSAGGSLLDMALARGIAVILGVGSVRYDEYLDILKQSAAGPETLPLVAVDLVESLLDVNAAAFQFDVHQRQAVHQYGNIVTIGAHSAIDFVLVDDLERIVVDIALVEQIDILDCSVVARQQLHMVFLNDGGLLYNSTVLVGKTTRKETRPLGIRKRIVIEFLQLTAQVGNQLRFSMNRQIIVCLFGQQFDKCPFKIGLRLVLFFRAAFCPVVTDDRTFGIFSNKVVFLHFLCA